MTKPTEPATQPLRPAEAAPLRSHESAAPREADGARPASPPLPAWREAGPALEAARTQIGACRRALIMTHIYPDGDAIGSMLGLGWALRALGKEAVLACADIVPESFRFLPGSDQVTSTPEGSFDLTVAVDVSDAARLGSVGERLGRPPDILVDHHVTNLGFAAINLLDASAASTAELLTDLLEPLNLPLTPRVAECLLAGLVNDTLGFRTSNTTAKSLAVAQKLMEAGARLHTIYDQSLFRRSYTAVRLWAEGLARLHLSGRVVWATLPLEARKASGYAGNGDADLIDVLTSVREADVAVIFVERTDGKVKVSWRSAPGIDVASLAAKFGGGGHTPAAGAEIVGSLEEVEAKVIAATKALLKAR